MNYIIYGNSFKLIDIEKDKIINGKNYTTFSLEEVSFNDILNDINYGSMFEEEKILVIKNFELALQNKTSLETLIEYLKEPNKNVTIIFISNEKINERVKINKELLSYVTKIETPIISKTYELTKILEGEFRKKGYAFTQNALNLMAQKCNCNYDIAMNEFNKLCKYTKNRIINEIDIENYISNYNTTDMFAFKDAVINKNIKKAADMLDDLEASKLEVFPLIIMLAKEYTEVLNIKLLAEQRLSNDQIGEKLNNMHSYRVKLLREAGNKYTVQELKNNILYLCKLNLKKVSQDSTDYDELRDFLRVI